MRNIELEGPITVHTNANGGMDKGGIYTVWYDCDCGRRLPLLASLEGQFILGNLNVWHLEIKGATLSTTPSILNKHANRECHFYITDERFTRISLQTEGPLAGLKAKE